MIIDFETLVLLSIGMLFILYLLKSYIPYFKHLNSIEYKSSVKPKTIKNKKIHETKCRQIIESIYNKPFPSIRPSWLKNHTNKNLELDMYNEELKLAIEYDGEQHYKYSPFFHKSPNDLIKQQERDKLKENICKGKGIRLIRIPYTVKFNELESYIKSKIVN